MCATRLPCVERLLSEAGCGGGVKQLSSHISIIANTFNLCVSHAAAICLHLHRMPCRYGKPLDDGLQWASEPESVAGLIRSHVQLMIADTQEVCDAFQQAASKVAAHMPADKQQQSAAEPAAAQEQLREKAAAAAAEVDADAHIALTYVRDSYGKLLYVVLLASLHKAGKDGEEVNRGADTAAEAAEAPGAAAVPAGQTD